MPQDKVAVGFEYFYSAVKQLQVALGSPFLDAFIETGENMLDNAQVRVLEGRPSQSEKEQLEQLYQSLNELALAPEEMRKVCQLVLLKGLKEEPVQANHQLTPDAIGFLFVFLIETLVKQQPQATQILDLTVGMGNLLTTVLTNLAIAKITVQATGVDVDETLLAVAAVVADLCQVSIDFYHQDSAHHLLVEPVDFAIADLPIGYYPDDQQAQEFLVAAKNGHTYAHHLLIEQSMNYVKPAGFGLFLLPSNFMETEQTEELKRWLAEKVYLQAVIHLPQSLFASKTSVGKVIVLCQNHGPMSQQAEQVLLTELGSLKDIDMVQRFFKEFQAWKTNYL